MAISFFKICIRTHYLELKSSVSFNEGKGRTLTCCSECFKLIFAVSRLSKCCPVIHCMPGYPSSKPWLAVYVSWPGEHPCRGQWVRSVCVFGVGDLPTLVRRPELFANKFFWWYQPIALDCLDQWLRHKEACPPVDDDLEYYRQLPFIIK
jgi:hypothetical protein